MTVSNRNLPFQGSIFKSHVGYPPRRQRLEAPPAFRPPVRWAVSRSAIPMEQKASKMVTRVTRWKFVPGKAIQISERIYPSFTVGINVLVGLDWGYDSFFSTPKCWWRSMWNYTWKLKGVKKKWSKWINWASLLTRKLSPPFHTGLFIGLAHEWMIYFHCKVILPKLNEGLNIKIPWITEECWLRIVTNSLRKTSQKDYMHHSKIIQMIPDFWIEVLFKWENQTTCFSTKLIKAQQSNNSLEREDKVCSATKGTNLTSRKKTLAQGSGKKSLASQLMVGFRNPAVEPVELGSLSHVVVGDRS